MSRRAIVLLVLLTACDDSLGPGSSSSDTILFVGAGDSQDQTQLFLMDLDGSAPRALTSGPWLHYSPAVSPDGRQVLFSRRDDSSGGAMLMNIDGSSLRPSSVFGSYVWSPTALRVVSIQLPGDVPDAMTLVVSDPDGSSPVPVAAGANQNIDPTWSPDGSRLAYEKVPLEDPGKARIWIVNANGGNDHPLTADTMYQLAPAWSPQGDWIAFTGLPRADGNNLSLASTDGNTPRELPVRCELGFQPRWSPDGARIACTYPSFQSGLNELVVVNVDGSGVDTLARASFFQNLSWSPDGRTLMVEGSVGSLTDVFLVRADGSSVTNLTNDPVGSRQPVWVP